jgi:adenosine deaminase
MMDGAREIEEFARRLLADERFTSVRDAAVVALDEEYARSDLILGCGGSDPDPGCDVVVRFQYLTIRTQPLPAVVVQALMAFEMARASSLVVGVNIAGPETHEISLRDYDLHMEVLGTLGEWYPEIAKSLHAAELTDRLAAEVGAVDHLRLAIGPVNKGGAAARRVGHAVSLDTEADRDQVLRRLAEERIAVEMNLRSNELLLGVKGLDHPLIDYLAAGVPIVLSTDDPGLMGTTLREQFEIAAGFEEVGYLDLRQFVLNSIHYSFLPEEERTALERELLGELELFEQRFAQAPKSAN